VDGLAGEGWPEPYGLEKHFDVLRGLEKKLVISTNGRDLQVL